MTTTTRFLGCVLIGLALGSAALRAQEATGTNVMYLLDVSGSMNENGLFDRIKARLNELVGERRPGDKVVLGTFSEDVLWPVKVDIHGPEDLADIKEAVDGLRARGPWTWMSEAFRQTKEKASEIRARSPERELRIYILTDCVNDPPPEKKKTEPPWGFVEVLVKSLSVNSETLAKDQ